MPFEEAKPYIPAIKSAETYRFVPEAFDFATLFRFVLPAVGVQQLSQAFIFKRLYQPQPGVSSIRCVSHPQMRRDTTIVFQILKLVWNLMLLLHILSRLSIVALFVAICVQIIAVQVSSKSLNLETSYNALLSMVTLELVHMGRLFQRVLVMFFSALFIVWILYSASLNGVRITHSQRRMDTICRAIILLL